MSRLIALCAFALLFDPNSIFARTDTLHVSPTGPLATLEAARKASRLLATQHPAAIDTVLVLLHGGTYRLSSSLVITSADVPQAGTLVWRAFPGTAPKISGSVAVRGFAPPPDSPERNRMAAGIRPSVLRADLKAQGILDYGTIAPRGNPGIELFYNGKRMDLARYPNQGWLNIADVPQSGDSLYNKGLEREKRFDGVPVGRHYGRITYPGDRPGTWAPAGDIIVHGYWTWDWSDTYQKVQKIDLAHHELTMAQPHHNYGYTKNQRFRFLNVLEELDTPGEWYLDRKAGVLYFAPPTPMHDGAVEVSMMEEPLTLLDECANVTFEGITFECTRGSAVTMNGGSHNTLLRCTFRNGGSDAVVMKGGTGHTVSGCEITEMARGAILVVGGDRKTLEPGKLFARNNHIHHFSRWCRTYRPAIDVQGVGHTEQRPQAQGTLSAAQAYPVGHVWSADEQSR